jgi:DNA-binding NtrC family response regulator
MAEIKTLSDKEKELLQKALSRTQWDLDKAARLLQIPISEVRKKIRIHGLKQGHCS